MKIAYITGGSAGMYCGTCMHDNTLASTLIDQGHEVSLIPTYTPLRLDEKSVENEQIFFGALNVYLQQKLAFFRKHKVFDRLLDSRRALGWISKLGVSSTSADELGALTLSMMQGENGHQARELDKLVEFLDEIVQPEVVHLSFTLFTGFARRIKERLGVPVICSLQGEDLFFEQLTEPWRRKTLDEMRSRLDDIDVFTAHSDYYADMMSETYGIPRQRIVRTRLGIRPDGFLGDEPASSETTRSSSDASGASGRSTVNLGFLARQCPEKGLQHLVDAFLLLAPELPELRLHVAGYVGGDDEAFVEEQQKKIEPFADRVLWRRDIERREKEAFLRRLDLFSVPTVYREAKGLYVAEALAAATPVVLPRHGAFPEWIERTGGGLLVEPDSVESLAAGLRELATDAERRRELAERGRRAVVEDYNHEVMAEEMLGIYRAASRDQASDTASDNTASGTPKSEVPEVNATAA